MGGPALVPASAPGPYDWEIVRYRQARWAISATCFSKDPHLAWETLEYDAFQSADATSEVRPVLNMANCDPPAHTRLRELAATALTPGQVRRMRPLIARAAEDLADRLARARTADVDLVQDFILPLQVTVTCDLLGIPLQRRADFRCLVAGLLAPARDGDLNEPSRGTYGQMEALIAEVLATKRDQPPTTSSAPDLTPDVLSALLSARHGPDRLTAQEIQSMAMLLVTAGQEPTIDLIANGVSALLAHPIQREFFLDHPEIRPQALEEILRYGVPVATLPRIVAEEVEIDGTVLHRGEIVAVAIGAAHRDPDQFPMPDDLDITRHPNPHMAFGRGSHYCIGAPLARMQVGIAIEVLLTRFPGMRLFESHHQRGANSMHVQAGLRALNVVLARPELQASGTAGVAP